MQENEAGQQDSEEREFLGLGMESSLAKIGSSLMKVPIVQELVKEKLASVPSRYVRHDHDHNHDHDHDHLISSRDHEIPIIDLHKLFDSEFMDSELLKLHTACKEWGFFQVYI